MGLQICMKMLLEIKYLKNLLLNIKEDKSLLKP